MANGSRGVRYTRLQDQTFGSGQTVSIQTAGALPPSRDVFGILFRLDLDMTQPGAAAAPQLGAVLHQLIAQIKMGRRVSITGLGLFWLNMLAGGRAPSFGAGFPATLGAVFSRGIEWYLPFADSSMHLQDDLAIPSELFIDPIEIRFGTNGIFAATAPALGNGVLRTYVVHGPSNMDSGVEGVVPPSLNIQSDDFNALVALIQKPGLYLRAVAYREASNDAGGITNLQAAAVNVFIDGEPVVYNARASDMAALYNAVTADGSTLKVESQTLPVAPEAINAAPAAAAAAGQGVTVDVLPLITQPKGYKLSQCPEALTGFKSEIAGTLGAYKIAYEIVEPRPESSIAKAAARLGIPAGKGVARTKDGKPVTDPRMLKYLPIVVTRG